jgi:hypothetical protein
MLARPAEAAAYRTPQESTPAKALAKGKPRTRQSLSLSVVFASPLNPQFEIKTPVVPGLPFKVTRENGWVRNTISGVLQRRAPDKYTLRLTVEEWKSERENVRDSGDLELELGRPWSGGAIGSSVYARTITLLPEKAGPEPTDKETIEAFLQDWKSKNLVAESEFDTLRNIGPKAMPILARYLTDKELGAHALFAMQKLDAVGATPYLLKNLRLLEPDQQHHTLAAAVRFLQEYQLHVRAGSPPPDPAKPAPRYPRNTKPYPYTKEVHTAAIQRLTAGDTVGAEREAALILGLTGTRRDIPLLRKFASPGHDLHTHSIAALARLGDKAALDEIAQELAKPVKTQPAAPVIRDNGKAVPPPPGALVTVKEDAHRLKTVMFQAAFSMNRRLVPLLIRHLDDPPGQGYGDYFDPSPAEEARTALGQIVMGQEFVSPQFDWKQWWQKHAGEYKGL